LHASDVIVLETMDRFHIGVAAEPSSRAGVLCSYLMGAWHRKCCGAVIWRCGVHDSGEEDVSVSHPIPSRTPASRGQRVADDVHQPLLESTGERSCHSVTEGASSEAPLCPHALRLSPSC
jgi:hypothetical protein